MAIKGLFVRTDPQRRRYGVALLVGVLSGIISAFVKWGAEVPLPPRTFSGGRDEFNPPYIFLRDYLGIDPTQTVYTFSEHIINPVMVTHIIFSLVFAIGYCVVAEIFPKVKLWQGILAGLIVTVAVKKAPCEGGKANYGNVSLVIPGASDKYPRWRAYCRYSPVPASELRGSTLRPAHLSLHLMPDVLRFQWRNYD